LLYVAGEPTEQAGVWGSGEAPTSSISSSGDAISTSISSSGDVISTSISGGRAEGGREVCTAALVTALVSLRARGGGEGGSSIGGGHSLEGGAALVPWASDLASDLARLHGHIQPLPSAVGTGAGAGAGAVAGAAGRPLTGFACAVSGADGGACVAVAVAGGPRVGLNPALTLLGKACERTAAAAIVAALVARGGGLLPAHNGKASSSMRQFTAVGVPCRGCRLLSGSTERTNPIASASFSLRCRRPPSRLAAASPAASTADIRRCAALSTAWLRMRGITSDLAGSPIVARSDAMRASKTDWAMSRFAASLTSARSAAAAPPPLGPPRPPPLGPPRPRLARALEAIEPSSANVATIGLMGAALDTALVGGRREAPLEALGRRSTRRDAAADEPFRFAGEGERWRTGDLWNAAVWRARIAGEPPQEVGVLVRCIPAARAGPRPLGLRHVDAALGASVKLAASSSSSSPLPRPSQLPMLKPRGPPAPC
jgi:hypothetical protein